MRIKRYFGKTIREAIQKVRAEQGPDAVILSNRKVEGGVELIAAIDFDEVILADMQGGAGSYGAGHEPAREVAATPAPPAPRGLINRRRDAASLPAAASPSDIEATPAHFPALNIEDLRAGAKSKPATVSMNPARAKASVTEEASTNAEFAEMRKELKSLRGMVERELSGLVWGDVARRDPVKANLLRLLLRMEVSPRLCRDIAAEIGGATDAQSAWRNALAAFAHRLPVTDDDILTRGGVVSLLGPTGVGKTTTIAKLAARYAVRHGARHVALVTTDNYRIGAVEQLRAYAKILDVPMRVASDAAGLKAALADLADRKLVLIDTAGVSQRDLRLNEQLALMKAGGETIRNYLVLSATTRASGIEETIQAYRAIALSGTILTKVDEAGSLGGALSLLIRHRLPVAYVSDGQRVPEDLSSARAHRLVSRSVAMMRREATFTEDEAFSAVIGGGAVHA
jgi:flagellar biosynthesis protein FlhF